MDKPVLGRLMEAAVRRQDALDDVLKAVFDRLPHHAVDAGNDADDKTEEMADKRLFVFRRGVEMIQREGQSRFKSTPEHLSSNPLNTIESLRRI